MLITNHKCCLMVQPALRVGFVGRVIPPDFIEGYKWLNHFVVLWIIVNC